MEELKDIAEALLRALEDHDEEGVKNQFEKLKKKWEEVK